MFEIRQHTLCAQHVREYARATSHDQNQELQLAVKQYIPIDNANPQPGDVTVIAAHANGYPKELYEPLWEELLVCSRRSGYRIRGIWIADMAHQGASGVLNEDCYGNDREYR